MQRLYTRERGEWERVRGEGGERVRGGGGEGGGGEGERGEGEREGERGEGNCQYFVFINYGYEQCCCTRNLIHVHYQ